MDTPAEQNQTLPVGKRIPDSVEKIPQGSKLVGFTNETGGCVGAESQNSVLTSISPIAQVCINWDTQGDLLLEAIDAYESCDKLGFRRVQCSFSQSLVCLIGEVKVDEEEAALRASTASRTGVEGETPPLSVP